MRRQTKKIWLLLVMALLVILPGQGVFAAVKAPARVKDVKAQAGDGEVSLTWKAAKGADGYYVFMVNPKTGKNQKAGKVGSGTKTAKTIKKLENGVNYTFQVAAYAGSGKQMVLGKLSAKVVAKPALSRPEKPELSVEKVTKKTVTLKWSKVKQAAYYEVFQKNAAGKYDQLAGEYKGRSYTVKGLKDGKEYTFKVRAVRKEGKLTAKSYCAKISAMPGSAAQQKKLLSQVRTTSAYSGSSNASMCYSAQVAEAYANYGDGGHAFSSGTKYFLWLNTYTFHLYVFTRSSSSSRWSMIYAWPCIIGRQGRNTPSGRFTLRGRKVMCDYGSYHSEWISYFTGYGTNGIHSLLYPKQSDYLPKGYMASSGCVRVLRKNAKFVYDHCEGSTLLIR